MLNRCGRFFWFFFLLFFFLFGSCVLPPCKVSVNYQFLFPGVMLSVSLFLWVPLKSDHCRLPLEERGRITYSCHHSQFFARLVVIFSSDLGTPGFNFIFSCHSVFVSPLHNCSSGLDAGRSYFMVYEEILIWWVSNAKYTYTAGAWVGNQYSQPVVPEMSYVLQQADSLEDSLIMGFP